MMELAAALAKLKKTGQRTGTQTKMKCGKD
jgi:hypothetical protein